MKKLEIVAKISVCNYDELNESEKNLIDSAKKTTQNSYAPYSQFQVGSAVLLGNGEIVTGSNQENAAYPSGLCAERTAIFYANSKYPDQRVMAIAVAASSKGEFTKSAISPCGSCRQVLYETELRYKQPIRLLLYGSKEIVIVNNVRDLLPLSFSDSSLRL